MINDEMVRINPEVCKNCSLYWIILYIPIRVNHEEEPVYYECNFGCSNDINNFFMLNAYKNKLYIVDGKKMDNDIKAIELSNCTEDKKIKYFGKYESKSFHPIDITDELKDACKNWRTTKTCPCYMEHFLIESNEK